MPTTILLGGHSLINSQVAAAKQMLQLDRHAVVYLLTELQPQLLSILILLDLLKFLDNVNLLVDDLRLLFERH